MTDLDLDALEAVARAATPGPWEYRHESPSMNGENCTIRQSGVPGIRMSAHVYGFGTGMIEHIAAFDPPTVRALITRIREAERERDGARWAAGIVGDVARESSGGWQDASAELHATQARLREAEALNDAARAVHYPVEALNTRYGRRQQVCAGCGTDDGNWMVWPCPTTRALTKAEGRDQ